MYTGLKVKSITTAQIVEKCIIKLCEIYTKICANGKEQKIEEYT